MENNRIDRTAIYEECLRDLRDTKAELAVAKERYAMAVEQGYSDYAHKYMSEVVKCVEQISVINQRIKALVFDTEE